MRQPNTPPTLPPGFQPLLEGGEWQAITIGMSGAEVYRVVAPGQPPRYLKIAAGPRVVELQAERERLDWLVGSLPIPKILAWEKEGEGEDARGWLLLTEAPGLMACAPACMREPLRVVRLLAEGLRQAHSVSIADCPFDARLDRRLVQAEWMIGAGLADEEAVRAGKGISAMELLRRLTATQPAEPDDDLVFTHGDYCLPNVLLDPALSRVTAFLDWGRAGIADRHQDLAIGARSVRHNLGPAWEPRFLAAYGLDQVDQRRLDWYEALDELF